MAVAKKTGAATKVVVKKPVAKKAVVKKTVSEKQFAVRARAPAPAKKASAPRTHYAPAKSAKAAKKPEVSGYVSGKEGLLIPMQKKAVKSENVDAIVPASNLAKGIAKAKDELNQAMQTINSVLLDNVQVTEIEVSVSFNAKGEFLGFGVGSSLTMKLKIQRLD